MNKYSNNKVQDLQRNEAGKMDSKNTINNFSSRAFYKKPYRSCLALLGIASAMAMSHYARAADINPANYDIYYGDLNNDGVSDIYFAGKSSIIIIDGDIATPILVSFAKSYVIYRSGTGYADAQFLNLGSSSISQKLANGSLIATVPNTDFYSWKNTVTGLNTVLVRGADINAPALVLSSYATQDLPLALQTYQPAGLANLSDRSVTISVQDQNGDGKADLVVAGYAYQADANGVPVATPVSTFAASVTQYSYDDLERVTCTAVRMNPAIFDSATALPADACALGATGSFGPDRITKNIYDAASQVREIRQGMGTVDERAYARYTYSDDGLKATEKDGNGNLTTLEYDGYNRFVKLRYPDTTKGAGTSSTTDYEQYGYDANDNRNSVRRRDGVMMSASFDNRNREIYSNTAGNPYKPQSLVPAIYTNYDPLGRLLSKRFNGSTPASPGVTYYYDSLGRLDTATDMNGKSVSYGYNQASVRTRLTYPDSQSQTYTLDALNRPTFTGMGIARVNLVYNALGQLNTITRGNGAGTSIGYDAIGRAMTYSHDLAGANYDISWLFAYNPASQVASVGTSSAVYDYKEKANLTENRTYDGLNRITTFANASGYDERGNLTGDGVRSFSYDIYNHLVGFSTISSSATMKLVYDPEGRLAKYSTDGGSNYTTLLYDGPNLIGEYQASAYNTPSNVLTRRYLHGVGTDQPFVQINGAEITNGALVRYSYTNNQGSVIALADNGGNKVEVYKYSPYGEPANENSDPSWAGESRFRYTGQYALPELRTYYYKARIYDPAFGRFLQTDPIGTKDDLNLYAYVGNDPTNKTDPTGLWTCKEEAASYCDIVETGLREAEAAMKNMNKEDAEKMRGILKAWGKRGEENHVTVIAGKIDGVARTSTKNGETTVTINSGLKNDAQQFAESTQHTMASTMIHEGQHIVDETTLFDGNDPRTQQESYDTERRAMTIEQQVEKAQDFVAPTGIFKAPEKDLKVRAWNATRFGLPGPTPNRW